MTPNNLQPERDWAASFDKLMTFEHTLKDKDFPDFPVYPGYPALKEFISKTIAAERDKLTAKFNYEKGKMFDRGMDMERARCIKEIEGVK